MEDGGQKIEILYSRIEYRGKRIEIEPALLENRKRRIENGNLLVHDIESNSKTKHSILLLCPLASNLYTLKAYRTPKITYAFYTVTSAFSAKSKILRENIAVAFATARFHNALLEDRSRRIEEVLSMQ